MYSKKTPAVPVTPDERQLSLEIPDPFGRALDALAGVVDGSIFDGPKVAAPDTKDVKNGTEVPVVPAAPASPAPAQPVTLNFFGKSGFGKPAVKPAKPAVVKPDPAASAAGTEASPE